MSFTLESILRRSSPPPQLQYLPAQTSQTSYPTRTTPINITSSSPPQDPSIYRGSDNRPSTSSHPLHHSRPTLFVNAEQHRQSNTWCPLQHSHHIRFSHPVHGASSPHHLPPATSQEHRQSTNPHNQYDTFRHDRRLPSLSLPSLTLPVLSRPQDYFPGHHTSYPRQASPAEAQFFNDQENEELEEVDLVSEDLETSSLEVESEVDPETNTEGEESDSEEDFDVHDVDVSTSTRPLEPHRRPETPVPRLLSPTLLPTMSASRINRKHSIEEITDYEYAEASTSSRPGPIKRRRASSDARLSTTNPSAPLRPKTIAEIDLVAEEDAAIAATLQRQRSDAIKAQQQSPGGKKSKLSTLTCSVCLDSPEDLTATACGHTFCRSCLLNWLMAADKEPPRRPNCPACRKPLRRTHKNDVIPLEIMTKRRK